MGFEFMPSVIPGITQFKTFFQSDIFYAVIHQPPRSKTYIGQNFMLATYPYMDKTFRIWIYMDKTIWECACSICGLA